VVKRPASVTSAIVVLAMICLCLIALAFIPTPEGRPRSWFSVSCGVILFGIPLFALATRRGWGRIYTSVIFALFAILLIYSNWKSSSAENTAVAVGYAAIICALLAWNIASLWSRRVTTYFDRSGPSQ
jgi:hypothetical protein